MVADELALELVERFVKPGDAVLDPFCGSGRLLVAASSLPGKRVGIDTNPLACLITRAKLASPDPDVLTDVLGKIDQIRRTKRRHVFELRGIRRVNWFPKSALSELAGIISWINDLGLRAQERLVLAVALSGAARDASYARKDGWKLHRIDAASRETFAISAWDCFERRLRYCIAEVSRGPRHNRNASIQLRDARDLAEARSKKEKGAFDVILTSPPYGDSRTTVQYGAASGLWLEFVSRIKGLEELYAEGGSIDGRCLGGSTRPKSNAKSELRPYWAGRKGTKLAKSVSDFLEDYSRACKGMANCLKAGGTAVIVVGQRSTGGYRLKLDRFTVDQLEALGLQAISVEERCLRDKRLPRNINRYARCESAGARAKGITRTMSTETILVFRKPTKNSLKLSRPKVPS